MAVNYVQLTGNMLAPEIRTVPSGKKVANASMVVKTWGEDNDDMWVDVQAWELLADNLETSFPTDQKSVRVMVEGTLRKDTWQDKDTGNNRSKFYINANNISICLDYQVVSGIQYSGEAGTFAQSQGDNAETPTARPMSEIKTDESGEVLEAPF